MTQKRLSTSLILVAAALTACRTQPQAASEIFADQRMLPADLQALANPQLKPSQARTVALKNPAGRVTVAVIDEGVDYLHPALYQQIKFTSRDNQIVAAGADMLGRDNFAHPNLIDPTLHALMATSLRDGRLVGAQGSPVEFILAMQKEFGDRMVQALRADTRLAGGPIQKRFTADTMSVFHVPKLLKDWDASSIESYQRNRTEGKLLTEANRASAETVRRMGVNTIRELLDQEWIPDTEGNAASGPNSYLDGYDYFMEHVKRVYEEQNSRNRLTARLAQVNLFSQTLNDDSVDALDGETVGKAWYKIRFPQASNPVIQSLSKICEILPEPVKKRLAVELALTDVQRVALVRSELVRIQAVVQQMIDIRLRSAATTVSERQQMDDYVRTSAHTLKFFDEMFRTRPYLARYVTCRKDLASLAARDAALVNYQQSRENPLLSSESAGATHGTHVAGIIARQSKRIDVAPVRVVTSSSAFVQENLTRIRQDFDRGFAQWIQIPEVASALSATARTQLGTASDAAAVQSMVRGFLDREFRSMFLDFAFFEQILKSIAYVGTNSIKIANMSLGTSFNKGILMPGEGNAEARIKNFAQFAIYEYFKYSVASKIQTSAPGTLFVIASGNDGAWLDGRSRSGLPCDLGSPMIAAAQSRLPLERQVPNNRLTNVLCVGSIDDSGLLSSFTNIPLTGVPFVLSTGEAILAPIKLSHCDGSAQQVQAEFGQTNGAPGFLGDMDDTALDPLFRVAGWWEADATETDLWMARFSAVRKADEFTNLGQDVRESVTALRCIAQRSPMARLSGTSMATPAVAGFIAGVLVKEASRRNLTDAQMYTMPEFAPSKLIDLIRDKSPAIGGSSIVRDIRTVRDIRQWSPAGARKVIGVVSPPALLPAPSAAAPAAAR